MRTVSDPPAEYAIEPLGAVQEASEASKASKVLSELGKPQIATQALSGALSTVTCGKCRHFRPDVTGDGTGIGHCALNAWRKGQPVLYPRALRYCASHEATEDHP